MRGYGLGDVVEVPMGYVGTIIGFPCRLSALIRFSSGTEARCWLSELRVLRRR